MCWGCWNERGQPQLDSSKIREAAKLIEEVYDHSMVGGNLHIVIDDWNTDDSGLLFCSKQIDDGGYKGETPTEQLEVERRCCDVLMKLTERERDSALGLYDGFWTVDKCRMRR